MKTLARKIRRMLDRGRDQQFIMALGGADLSDAGIGRADRYWITNAPADTRERMEAMARSLGLDPAEIGRDRWRELEMGQACSQCSDVRACRKHLDGKPVNEGPNTFCPNFQRFQDMIEQA
jgi:hypothetical protein